MFFRTLFSGQNQSQQPAIVLAQFQEVRRQIPLLYSLLTVNVCAVSYTHFRLAPLFLTLLVPTCLAGVSVIRLVNWLQYRKTVFTCEQAAGHLRKAVCLGGVIGAFYVGWALLLVPYGSSYEQAHVAIFVSITVMGCIFCLMYLPQAALTVTVVVNVPYLSYYLAIGNPVFIAIAFNIVLVTAVMLKVSFNSYKGLRQLVLSRGELERLNQENTRLAHTDALSELPNRRFFMGELSARIDAAERDGVQLAVGLIDLDRFKTINDTFGHAVGDRLITEASQRLKAVSFPGLVVARLGGDEFGFFLRTDGADGQTLGDAFCEAVSGVFVFDDLSLTISSSVGLVLFPEGGRSANELFDRADYALYHSKQNGRGRATVYSSDHEDRIRSEQALELALRHADLESEMSVVFQPIVCLESGSVTSVESLARWTSPVLGSVRPDLFITAAERIGVIHDLTLVLFQKAIRALETLPANTSLSFNLSAHDMANQQTVLALVAAVHRSGVDPTRIVLELTETVLMRDMKAAEDAIRLLRTLGIRFALDDFGTGYSSLNYLHRLPIDKVKIDRSFVGNLETSNGRKLLSSILSLCRDMDLKCVVEGVETVEQLAILTELGGRIFQGYLFAKPMALSELGVWIDRDIKTARQLA